jgi:hypothetical protein
MVGPAVATCTGILLLLARVPAGSGWLAKKVGDRSG